MSFLDKMERKFGKYAVHNLPVIMIGLYVAGYILSVISPSLLAYLTLSPYYIVHGQVWRIVTWVIVPPSSLDLFTIIMLLFYFSLGKTLERTWGAFRFNVYIFGGMIFTVIGAFVLYGIYSVMGAHPLTLVSIGYYFTTYYINMSIFLAFALTYPDMQVLLYFVIPIKMKWMGAFYGVMLLLQFVNYGWAGRVAIIASLLNFVVYFLMTRNTYRFKPSQMKRRSEFKKQTKKVRPKSASTLHRCAICGRTEKDDPNLVFRYCSKCDGAYEYCQDHLFNHEHIRLDPNNNTNR